MGKICNSCFYQENRYDGSPICQHIQSMRGLEVVAEYAMCDAIKNASQKQIEWEFKYLNSMDIFTMYFTNSENSVQPICLYELGRHLERMIHRFPGDWKDRIIIGIEDGYSRTQDVIIQSRLALRCNVVQERITPEVYAQMIYKSYYKLRY